MNKNTVMLLSVLTLGGVAAYFFFKMRSQAIYGVAPVGGQTTGGQPEQQYPLQNPALAQPRVDNVSEPWYGGALDFLKNPSGQYSDLQKTALAAKSTSSIIESASDIWDNLDIGSWFSGDDTTAAEVDTDWDSWFSTPDADVVSGLDWGYDDAYMDSDSMFDYDFGDVDFDFYEYA